MIERGVLACDEGHARPCRCGGERCIAREHETDGHIGRVAQKLAAQPQQCCGVPRGARARSKTPPPDCGIEGIEARSPKPIGARHHDLVTSVRQARCDDAKNALGAAPSAAECGYPEKDFHSAIMSLRADRDPKRRALAKLNILEAAAAHHPLDFRTSEALFQPRPELVESIGPHRVEAGLTIIA